MKMENLSTVAKTAGLRINANESKNMRIKNRNLGQIKIRELQTEKGAVLFLNLGQLHQQGWEPLRKKLQG